LEKKVLVKRPPKGQMQDSWVWEESVSEEESGRDGSGGRVLPFLTRQSGRVGHEDLHEGQTSRKWCLG